MADTSEQRTAPERKQGEPPGWRIEGLRRQQQGGPGQRSGDGRPGFRFGRLWWIFLGLLFLNWLIVYLVPNGPNPLEVPYTTFRREVAAGNVEEITSRGDTIQGIFKKAITFPGTDDAPSVNPPEPRTSDVFETERPSFGDDELIDLLLERGVIVNARPLDEGRSVFWTIIFSFGPVILLVALFVFLSRRMAGAAGGIGGLGRSRAKRYDASQQRTTFSDVAGIDEAEEELVEVVDFLKNPDKYRKLGASIPKGVLLSGPPGTGKTLLARAVAGEANVPFFSLSASEFVEMIVGVGASRVRDLFKQAKESAPAIVFIDELDAIGRARGSSGSIGGHDEREQTLNQILTEMDGFTGSEGVIVLAATNRPEILDAALLRPGRFDRRVVVSPPDQAGRAEILRVHTRSVPLGDDVDLPAIASSTPGMVGADLKNLVNEAALMAARRGHKRVQLADFTDSLEKIVLGAERRIMLSPEERERTAYHESGHAILGMLIPGADPVRKVSIVPRGRALGVTFQSPESDRYGYDVAYLRGRIVGALGGRAAEELVYGNVTTGAESDLEQVTRIARQMVGRWGMSDLIGPVSVLPGPNDEPLLFPGTPGAGSEKTRELVDSEARRIIEECYADALRLIAEHRAKLEALTQALLAHETLDEEDAYRAAGVERRPTQNVFGQGKVAARNLAADTPGQTTGSEQEEAAAPPV